MKYYEPYPLDGDKFIIPPSLINAMERGIALSEVWVYSVLKNRMDNDALQGKSQHDEKGYYTTMNFREIAEMIGLGYGSVRGVRAHMKHHGLIETGRKYGKYSPAKVRLIDVEELWAKDTMNRIRK